MKKNICKFDRFIRISAGILIMVAGIYYENLLGLIGIIPFTTGLISSCPLYTVLGLNTCKPDNSK